MLWWLGAQSPVLMLYLLQDFAGKHQALLYASSLHKLLMWVISAMSSFLRNRYGSCG